MNQMIYKEIDVHKVVYKIFTTTNLNSMRFLFKSVKNKEGWAGTSLPHPAFGPLIGGCESGQCCLTGSKS